MNAENSKIVAVTGGTGFVGTNLIHELIKAGHKVRALTRRPRSGDDAVTWVPGSLEDKASLQTLVEGADAVIHLAGLTKALTRQEYFTVNADAVITLAECADKAGVKRFLHMSSMAAREPKLSDYGASKAVGDQKLMARTWGFDWTIIRPPAIYGPHEKEILKLLKAAGGLNGRGILPAPAGKAGVAGFIHAQDLSKALIALLDDTHAGEIIEIDDGKVGGYDMTEVAAAIANGRDGMPPRIISVPYPVLWLVGLFSDAFAAISRRALMTSRSHMRYLAHPDWAVHEQARAQIPNWKAEFDLNSGFKDTFHWAEKTGAL